MIEKESLSLNQAQQQVFTKALLTFFRQIRSAVDLKSILVGSLAERGLGISPDTADTVLSIVRHLREKIDEADGVVLEEQEDGKPLPPALKASLPKSQEMASVPPDVKPLTPMGTPPSTVPPMPQPKPEPTMGMPSAPSVTSAPTPPSAMMPSIPPSEVLPPTPKVTPPPPMPEPKPVPNIEPVQTSKPADITPVKEELWPTPKVARPSPAASNSMMHDVKAAPPRPMTAQESMGGSGRASKLMGRVEELAGMDLATWRLLDENPRIRAGKILGKVQNLEQESFIRRSQGVDAWRSSETYRLYLSLGQNSLEHGKQVAQVISEMQAQGQPTLTLDEFEAISDLNRMLRF